MPTRNVRRARVLTILIVFALGVLYYKSPSSPSFREAQEGLAGSGAFFKEKTFGDSRGHEPAQEAAPLPNEPVEAAVPLPVDEIALSTHTSSSSTSSSSSSSSKHRAATAPPRRPILYEPDDDVAAPGYRGRYGMDALVSTSTSTIHWSKPTEHYPLSSTISLPTGTPKPMPRVQNLDVIGGADEERLAVIKQTAEKAWSGYKRMAWKADEVMPITGGKKNPFMGWGATLVDALDTLWIMDMREDFEEAVKAVGEIDFTTSQRGDIPLFETTIRYLGGMIAAYDLSGEKYSILLDKAVELAEILYGAFDTPNRMPVTYPRWAPQYTSQPHRAGTRVVLAEIGSLSVEFTRLAQLTKEPKYYDAIARITDEFEAWQNNTRLPGMWPTYVDASGCDRPPPTTSYGTSLYHDTYDVDGKVGMAGPPVRGGEPKLAAQQAAVEAQRQRQKDLDFANGKNRDTIDNLGSSKAKRQLTDLEDGQTEEQHSRKNESSHQQDLRSLSDLLTDPERCIPKGLGSVNENSMETFTLGGMADSIYEYFPKEHMLLGGITDQYKKMYLDSADAAMDKLLYRPMTPGNRDILFSGELRVRPNYTTGAMIEDHVADGAHLTCFAGGMFALGGVLFDRPEDVRTGAKLTDGCVWAYNSTATGIMPEGFLLLACQDKDDCEWDEKAYWHALDPYEETRTAVRPPLPYLPQMMPQTTRKSRIGEAASTSTPLEDFRARPEKRQLDEAGIDDPKPPQPANAPVAKPEPARASGPQLPGPVLPAPQAVYTPKPPMSHKDYVKEKIQDERLPPGMVRINSRNYLLRPEAIESVFYLYRITGDQHWRDAGWDMFTAIHDHTQAMYGASAIDDVTKEAPEGRDSEESFWLGETLKYFYLLFDDPKTWSLDEWVLNTEAHFLRRPKYEFKGEE